jgi:hypothetical protein
VQFVQSPLQKVHPSEHAGHPESISHFPPQFG